MSIKMKKSDLAIAYAVIAVILAGVLAGLAGCQMGMMDSLDLGGTPSSGVDTGPVGGNGGYGGGSTPPTPAPSIALYWDGNEAVERTGDIIQWPVYNSKAPVTETAKAKAVFLNPPEGFEYLQWTFDTNAGEKKSADGTVEFGDDWHTGAQGRDSSEMPIIAGLNTTEVKITVWNCDSTGKRGRVSSSFTLDVVAVGTPIPVASVTVVPIETLAMGATDTLTATVGPGNAANPAVTWESGNPDVATVDQNGRVTGSGTKWGRAVITATAKDGSGKSDTCTVTVKPKLPYVSYRNAYGVGPDFHDYGSVGPHFSAWSLKLEWKFDEGADVDDSGYGDVVQAALTAAKEQFEKYMSLIDPRPFYDDGGEGIAPETGDPSFKTFNSGNRLKNSVGESPIVIHRYWLPPSTPSDDWVVYEATETARVAAWNTAVENIKAMMADIERSPLDDTGNILGTLYTKMGELIPGGLSPAPTGQQNGWGSIGNGIVGIPAPEGLLYQYYLGYIPKPGANVDYVNAPSTTTGELFLTR